MSQRRSKVRLPATEYLGSFHTKYAAQTFIQGISLVLTMSGVDPPAFGILAARDRALFGMRTLWQVWKPKI